MNWADVKYETMPLTDERLSIVVDILKRTHANGGVILNSFRPVYQDAFDEAYRTDLQGMDHLLKCFLESEMVRSSIPQLNIPYPLSVVPAHVWYSGYEFEGAIVRLILRGGAYVRFEYSTDYARKLARDFVDVLIGDYRLGVTVYRIDESWTDWFYDVAWDATYIIFNLWEKNWTIFCITDTD